MGHNGSVALEAQKIECQAAVKDIKASPAMPKCEAHGPLARGVIALLNVNIAQIDMQQKREAAQAKDQLNLRFWILKGLIRLGALIAIVAVARIDDTAKVVKGILSIFP